MIHICAPKLPRSMSMTATCELGSPSETIRALCLLEGKHPWTRSVITTFPYPTSSNRKIHEAFLNTSEEHKRMWS